MTVINSIEQILTPASGANPPAMVNSVFTNQPIRNLTKSAKSFALLGLFSNGQFTNQNKTCMIIGEGMLEVVTEEAALEACIDWLVPDVLLEIQDPVSQVWELGWIDPGHIFPTSSD